MDHQLKLSPKIGLNGQMRLIEAPCQLGGCTTDQYKAAIVFGFEAAKYTDPDYIYIKGDGVDSYLPLDTNLKGKQRNTFGRYLVMNKNLN